MRVRLVDRGEARRRSVSKAAYGLLLPDRDQVTADIPGPSAHEIIAPLARSESEREREARHRSERMSGLICGNVVSVHVRRPSVLNLTLLTPSVGLSAARTISIATPSAL
jgi:hypothetical protein